MSLLGHNAQLDGGSDLGVQGDDHFVLAQRANVVEFQLGASKGETTRSLKSGNHLCCRK